jgi:ATP-binding cassette subfamily C protein LapB
MDTRAATSSHRCTGFPQLPASGRADLLVASALINLLSLVLPLALLQVYDRILPTTAENTLALLVIGVLVALFLETLLRMARDTLTGWHGAQMEHRLGCAAVTHLLRAEQSAFERDGAGVHLQRLNAVGALREFYSGHVMILACDLPFALLYLAAVAYLGGPLVAAPVTLMAVFAVAAVLVGGRLRHALGARMQADDRRFNFTIEVLRGVHTIKAMAMESQMLRRYERLQEASAAAQGDAAKLSGSALALGALFTQINLFTVVGLGALLVVNGELTVGGLAACTMLSGRSMEPLRKAVGVWTRFQRVRLARGRLDELFSLAGERETRLPDLPAIRGEIELDNVSFRFPGKDRDVLSDVSLSIAPGDCVAITGGNASGKTTLLHLMLGLQRPTAGRIRIDGQDPGTVEPESIRRQIAYLPQVVTLFDGTIEDNITMFRRELADKAQAVADFLGLDDLVARMPLGYATRVGFGCDETLPRGIRQQIGLARALMDAPNVILFDEANLSLDRRGDGRLLSALARLLDGRTVVLVTHRPSYLALADRVYELRDGTLALRQPAERQPAAQAQAGVA